MAARGVGRSPAARVPFASRLLAVGVTLVLPAKRWACGGQRARQRGRRGYQELGTLAGHLSISVSVVVMRGICWCTLDPSPGADEPDASKRRKHGNALLRACP